MKKVLAEVTLPDLLPHNSRLFVDLCENVHIHYREFRIVFSVDEFLEFAAIVEGSTRDLTSYLDNNPDYREQAYRDTIIICGGPDQQVAPLRNSPRPNEPAYFANWFAIELQEESVIDEVQVHWRNYRFGLPRDHLRLIAEAFSDAVAALDDFEEHNSYVQLSHKFRGVGDQAEHAPSLLDRPHGLRAQSLALDDLQLDPGFRKNPPRASSEKMSHVLRLIEEKQELAPVLVCQADEPGGLHRVVDGHHRVWARRLAGFSEVPAVILPLSFEDTLKLREAEVALKEFDRETGFCYGTSGFLQAYLGSRFARNYVDDYRRRFGGNFSDRLKRFAHRAKRKIGKLASFSTK